MSNLSPAGLLALAEQHRLNLQALLSKLFGREVCVSISIYDDTKDLIPEARELEWIFGQRDGTAWFTSQNGADATIIFVGESRGRLFP